MSISKVSGLLLVICLSSESALAAFAFSNPIQPIVELFKPSTAAPVERSTVPTSSLVENVGPFEAFISYRRNPSRNLAMLLKVLLTRENVSAYLDVEDLKGGHWDEQLRAGIEESPVFILVLGNGTLDRLKGDVNYTDFMHQEIQQAVIGNKRIVLVFDEFNFPNMADYSPEVQEALMNQGLTWEHKLVDQSIERLISYMRESGPFKTLQTKAALPSPNENTLVVLNA